MVKKVIIVEIMTINKNLLYAKLNLYSKYKLINHKFLVQTWSNY